MARRGRPNRAASSSSLDGQTLNGIDFALSRGGVITGRITDHNGEPQAGIPMSALRLSWGPSGTRQHERTSLRLFDRILTDDLGQYRIYGLSPGSYIVAAGAAAPGMMGMPEPPVQGTTYFPGTANVDEAQSVEVEIGQEVPVHFALAAAPLARVSGTIVDSSGRPVVWRSVMLATRTESGFGTRTAATTRPDGTFDIPGCPSRQLHDRSSAVTNATRRLRVCVVPDFSRRARPHRPDDFDEGWRDRHRPGDLGRKLPTTLRNAAHHSHHSRWTDVGGNARVRRRHRRRQRKFLTRRRARHRCVSFLVYRALRAVDAEGGAHRRRRYHRHRLQRDERHRWSRSRDDRSRDARVRNGEGRRLPARDGLCRRDSPERSEAWRQSHTIYSHRSARSTRPLSSQRRCHRDGMWQPRSNHSAATATTILRFRNACGRPLRRSP